MELLYTEVANSPVFIPFNYWHELMVKDGILIFSGIRLQGRFFIPFTLSSDETKRGLLWRFIEYMTSLFA